ncbi:Wzz/FepE/Etk N-terminal domain-containing protein [Spirosoma flavum]|uniref:Wzz/FepE/Etk N-terminal domain-containing protein n=1 Tax=Spirosoma flavum TaxID=2048557 RepID=A0ABW6ACZ4_9BACT
MHAQSSTGCKLRNRNQIYMIVLTESKPVLSTNRWLRLPTDVIIRTLWKERYKVLVAMFLFIGLGIITALLMQQEFRSEARIMPEMNNGSGDILKRLASVAGFAGVDFSDADGMDAIRPDLYPNVLQSTPFVLYLIDQSITTTDGQVQTVGQFLLHDDNRWSWKQLLPFNNADRRMPLPLNKANGTVQLSASQQELAEDIGERVSAKFDTRSGIITIAAKMPDANVAATVAQIAMNYLTQYVTNYRTEKARQDLHFYGQRLKEAQQRYHTAQLNVFQYNDHNRNVVMLATTMERHRMEAELTIAQTVYTELSRQFEQSKLKVQARTPVFKVLEPPKVPLKRISPKRLILVLLFAVLGLGLGIVYVLAQKANVAGRFRAMVADD